MPTAWDPDQLGERTSVAADIILRRLLEPGEHLVADVQRDVLAAVGIVPKTFANLVDGLRWYGAVRRHGLAHDRLELTPLGRPWAEARAR